MGNNCLIVDPCNTKIVLHITCQQFSKEITQQTQKPSLIITQDTQIDEDFLIVQKNDKIDIIKNSQIYNNIRDIKQKLLDINVLLDFTFRLDSICIGKKLFQALRKKNTNETDIWYTLTQKKLIQKGDIFKIGEYRFHVLNIHLRSNNRFKQIVIPSKYISRQKNKTCKICYDGDIYRQNPLITPCLCTGSIRYIHIQCLKEQIRKSNAIQKTQHCFQLYKNKLACKICKENYWDLFQKQILFVSEIMKRRQGTFIELEIIQDYKKTNSIIVLVDFGNLREIEIGRSSKAQIKLNSDNVSRKHAKLVFKTEHEHWNHQNQIYLVDNNSMIGTYLQMKKEIEIKDFQQKDLELKIGSEYIKFEKNICYLKANEFYLRENYQEVQNERSSEKIDKIIQKNIDNIMDYAYEKKFKSEIFPTQVPQVQESISSIIQ